MDLTDFSSKIKDSKGESLDHTLFRRVTFAAFITAFLATIANVSIKLYTTSIGTGVISVVFLSSYFAIKKYRAYQRLRPVIIILIILSYCFLWITNAGSEGNIIMIACPILITVIICTQKKERVVWLVLTNMVFISMYIIEYFFPEIIIVTYESRLVRFIDISISVVFFSLSVVYLMQVVKNRFDIEKELVGKQNRSLVSANESLAKLERFMDNANDALQVSDLSGKLVYANKVARERLGLKKEEVGSVYVKDFEKRFQDDEDWKQHISEVSKAGKIVFEGINQNKGSGKSFPVEVSISIHEIIDEKFVVAVSRDISERKAFEVQQMETIQELKKANTELDNFIYRVSHDLRAPLTSTLGLNALLKVEENSKIQEEYIELQEKSLKKLDRFILDILNYSRNSRLEVTFKAIDLYDSVQQIITNLEHHNSADVEIDVQQQIDSNFISDAVRVEMILNNLLSNAIKFQNSRKEQHQISISITVNEELAKIEISDNGIGIIKEHQDKIFEMFYRATDLNYGSGLGLYIVKEAVDFLNGTLQLESTEGEGTTFLISLPNNLLHK